MRFVAGFAVVVVALLAGCRKNAPLTNPFLTPDRVPPPSTGAIAPGTAAPVYAGDPILGSVAPPATVAPGATTYAPPAAAPIGTAPMTAPAPVYGTPIPAGTPYQVPAAVPSYQSAPVTPATPPAGWPPTSAQLQGGGDSVRLATDEQPLRFDAATVNGGAMPTPALATTPVSAASAAGSATPARMPIQDLLPLAEHPRVQRLAGQQEVEQASWGAPLAGSSSEEPGAAATAVAQASSGVARLGGDGFRPQGTTSAAELQAADSGFRVPEIRSEAMNAQDSTAKYGVGQHQDWLRGQLEYWPELSKWSIRYMDPAGPVDQIGGRVQIENPHLLGNLPPGEFVMVRGQVFGQQVDAEHYQPVYRVATVERQAR